MEQLTDKISLFGIVLLLAEDGFIMNKRTVQHFPHGGDEIWNYSPYFWFGLVIFLAVCFICDSKAAWAKFATHILASTGYVFGICIFWHILHILM